VAPGAATAAAAALWPCHQPFGRKRPRRLRLRRLGLRWLWPCHQLFGRNQRRRLRCLGLRPCQQLLLFGRKHLVEDLPLLELRLGEDLPLLLQLRLEFLPMVLKQHLHRRLEERALLRQLISCDRGESLSALRLL
jgi:hypothetical protein